MSWQTVAICEEHWREEEGARIPLRLTIAADEIDFCYRCDCPLNRNVIYVRRYV